MKKVLAGFCCIATSCFCSAAGTLETKELIPLLNQKPKIKNFIFQNFESSDGALAMVRMGNHFKNLGGKRLGPYIFSVTPKGSNKKSDVAVMLCTSYQLLNKKGQVIKEDSPDETNAAAVKETLLSVQLIQEADIDRASCPD